MLNIPAMRALKERYPQARLSLAVNSAVCELAGAVECVDQVLASYDFNCALCRMSLPAMLNASHIIPWAVNKQRRADPRNGICLCALHDRAFDRGLITVCEDYKIAVSREIKTPNASKLHRIGLLEIEGEKINLPDRFWPDPAALAYHREKIFLQ